MDTRNIKKATKEIVALLVDGEYAEIERRTRGMRLSKAELHGAVEEYGRRLRMPPDEMFDSMSIIEVTGGSPRSWSVVCSLWTEEEGRSDLSLELTLVEVGDEIQTELDNLHVL